MPVHLAWLTESSACREQTNPSKADANRALLDRRVVRNMLGFDDAVYEGVRMLAAKWRAEPSVHGGKRRPVGGWWCSGATAGA